MLTINFHPFQSLATERLVLRRICQDDLDGVIAMRGNPETMRYIPRPLVTTVEEGMAHIATIESALESNTAINWVVTLKDNDAFMGVIGLYRIQPENHRAELGYMLLPEHHGKGYVTEAIDAVLAFGFETVNFHSIEAVIDPDNIASERVLQKNGFVKEAHILENELWEGKFWDTIIYSLLRRNFRK
jgi:ribosomal-protein-alanine N-acetyltransferase